MTGARRRAGSAAPTLAGDESTNAASVGDRFTALAGQGFDDGAEPGDVADSPDHPEVQTRGEVD